MLPTLPAPSSFALRSMPIRSFPIGSFPTGPARRHAPREAIYLTPLARAACFALLLLAVAPVAAQQAPAGAANGAAGANAAAGDGNAPRGAPNNGLHGVSKEDALLGGPGAYRDPYRSALDAGDMEQSDLMKAERVPNGTTGDGAKGYDPLPPGGRRNIGRRAPAAADAGGVGAGGGVGVGAAGAGAGAGAGVGGVGAGAGAGAGVGANAAARAAPPDAQQAARSLYTDPFGGGTKGAAQQVYHTPW